MAFLFSLPPSTDTFYPQHLEFAPLAPTMEAYTFPVIACISTVPAILSANGTGTPPNTGPQVLNRRDDTGETDDLDTTFVNTTVNSSNPNAKADLSLPTAGQPASDYLDQVFPRTT